MNKGLTKKLNTGHSSCTGCAFPAIVRTVLGATDDPIVVANATGCLEVTSTLHPYTAWKVPYIHNAFENAGATMSGVETAYRVFKKSGKYNLKDKKVKFIAFGGDGGTYDIGLQSLSGALERGHDFLYVCYDNEGYMNTGNQRSGATPYGAATETTPTGKMSSGKVQFKKDLMKIAIAHNVKYAAQANVAFLKDLEKKAKKAIETKGPTFMLVFSPCSNNWKFPTSQYVNIAKAATETNFWPLYEYDNGKYEINWEPTDGNRKPIEEFLKGQGRFKHLFRKENSDVVVNFQTEVDRRWDELLKLEKDSN